MQYCLILDCAIPRSDKINNFVDFIHIIPGCFTANRKKYMDRLVQEWRNSSALAMGFCLFCTKPSILTKTGSFAQDTCLLEIWIMPCVLNDYGCFSQQGVNSMASSCLTTTTSVLISAVTTGTSLGMTSMVTSSWSRSKWSVPAGVPPTPTNLIPTTHVAKQVISVEPQVRCWYKSHNNIIAALCLQNQPIRYDAYCS